MKNSKKLLGFSLALAGLLAFSFPAFAAILPDGGGIVYGKGFGFNLKAPKGWTLDTESGVSQGLNAVFYPNGSSWSDSPIVAYAQSRPKTPTIQTADDAAKDTIQRFHEKGQSPNYQGSRLKTLKTNGGGEAVLYQFSGDQWGNHEICAYFVEKERINFIVMNSRDKKLFDQNLSAFEALAKSYLPMKVDIVNPPAK